MFFTIFTPFLSKNECFLNIFVVFILKVVYEFGLIKVIVFFNYKK